MEIDVLQQMSNSVQQIADALTKISSKPSGFNWIALSTVTAIIAVIASPYFAYRLLRHQINRPIREKWLNDMISSVADYMVNINTVLQVLSNPNIAQTLDIQKECSTSFDKACHSLIVIRYILDDKDPAYDNIRSLSFNITNFIMTNIVNLADDKRSQLNSQLSDITEKFGNEIQGYIIRQREKILMEKAIR